MGATTHKTVPWLAVAGQLVAASLAASVVLVVSCFLYVATGLLQGHVQVVTAERSASFRYSIHFLGAIVDDSESRFRFLCLLLLLPSLAVGALVWRHFRRRWKGHHDI
jgi:H+/Cl- antiporter ClcA